MGTGTSASRRCLLCEVVWDSMARFARTIALLLALSRVQSSGNLRLPYVTQHIGSGGRVVLIVLAEGLDFVLSAQDETCDSLGLRTRNGQAHLKDKKEKEIEE